MLGGLQGGGFCYCLGSCTGVSFIDSTPIRACHSKRDKRYKALKMGVDYGCSSMGWGYGCKLHLIVNDKGEVLDFRLTPGNTNDSLPLYAERFTEKFFGRFVADKGHISQGLFEHLFVDDIPPDCTQEKEYEKRPYVLV